jgi:hypothetical protein
MRSITGDCVRSLTEPASIFLPAVTLTWRTPAPTPVSQPRARTQHRLTVPAGTCQSFDNTATFITGSSGATGSASKTVTLCVGVNLTASKTANPYFTRTYKWSILKNVNKILVEQSGGTAKFNHAVDATQTGFTDSAWTVWQAITANVADVVNNGGACVVNA